MSKLCYRCGEEKGLGEFHPNPSTKDKLMNMCKTCHKKGDLTQEEKKEKAANYYLMKTFGLCLEDYEKMEKIQNGLCAICDSPRKKDIRLNVDHDHATGKVRGLLCPDCNRALGLFKDDPNVLDRAVKYLRLHKEKV